MKIRAVGLTGCSLFSCSCTCVAACVLRQCSAANPADICLPPYVSSLCRSFTYAQCHYSTELKKNPIIYFLSVLRLIKSLILECLYAYVYIIGSVDSINRDERGFPLTQYITNGGISRARYAIMHFNTTIMFRG